MIYSIEDLRHNLVKVKLSAVPMPKRRTALPIREAWGGKYTLLAVRSFFTFY